MRISCCRKSESKNQNIIECFSSFEWAVFNEKDDASICLFYLRSGRYPVIRSSEGLIRCVPGRSTSLKEKLIGKELHFFKGQELLLSFLRKGFTTMFSNNFSCYVPKKRKKVVAEKLKGFSPWSYSFLGVKIYYPLKSDVEFFFDIFESEIGYLDEIICFSVLVFGLHYDS